MKAAEEAEKTDPSRETETAAAGAAPDEPVFGVGHSPVEAPMADPAVVPTPAKEQVADAGYEALLHTFQIR